MQKSPGQLAYEADVRAAPKYPDGAPRRSWAALPPIVRDTWERNSTPRDYSLTLQRMPK